MHGTVAGPCDIAAEMVSRKMGKAARLLYNTGAVVAFAAYRLLLPSALLVLRFRGSATVAALVICMCVCVFLN